MAERFISLSTNSGVVEWTHTPALDKLTSKFSLSHGGNLKPRPDHNNHDYTTEELRGREKEKLRIANLRKNMAKADVHEALIGEAPHEDTLSFLPAGTVELPKDVQNGPLTTPLVELAPKLKDLVV